jgi:Arc/MetJ-type ribon-helix-helix transcriptional regulator
MLLSERKNYGHRDSPTKRLDHTALLEVDPGNKVKSGRYTDASEVVREALRRLEQEELLAEQSPIVDPDDVVSQVRKGMVSVAEGDCTELKGDQELRDFFGDIVARGTQRLEARRRVARR